MQLPLALTETVGGWKKTGFSNGFWGGKEMNPLPTTFGLVIFIVISSILSALKQRRWQSSCFLPVINC
jgi:hypothetical protein